MWKHGFVNSELSVSELTRVPGESTENKFLWIIKHCVPYIEPVDSELIIILLILYMIYFYITRTTCLYAGYIKIYSKTGKYI